MGLNLHFIAGDFWIPSQSADLSYNIGCLMVIITILVESQCLSLKYFCSNLEGALVLHNKLISYFEFQKKNI